MIQKIFKGKSNDEKILAPIQGKTVNLEDVPDSMFSKKLLGDGLAIEPIEGKVVAPIKGRVIQMFPTKHAIGIGTDNGVEILIHIGLETVSMDGEGFEAHVEANDKVKAGDLLVSFDLNKVQEKAGSTISPIIVTNGQDKDRLERTNEKEVVAGKTMIFTYRIE